MNDETLLERRARLYSETMLAYKKLTHARNLCYLLEERFCKLKREYELADYQLALVDGRTRILTRADVKKSQVKTQTAKICARLTAEQIEEIAETLGICLDEDKEESEEENE